MPPSIFDFTGCDIPRIWREMHAVAYDPVMAQVVLPPCAKCGKKISLADTSVWLPRRKERLCAPCSTPRQRRMQERRLARLAERQKTLDAEQARRCALAQKLCPHDHDDD